MASYRTTMKRTLNPSFSVGVISMATTGRRAKVFGILLGSEHTPNDWAIDWQIQRCTTTGTAGSAPTIFPDDPADIAAVMVAGQAHSADPTLTAGIIDDIPLNLRATYLWETTPGSGAEILIAIPGAGVNGLAFRTPTINPSTNTPLVTARVRWTE